jgi:hypothetical protein
MYIYICIYTYTFVYAHIHIYLFMHIYIHAYIFKSIHNIYICYQRYNVSISINMLIIKGIEENK